MLQVALRDLEPAIRLDRNLDGAITWGELKARHGTLADYVQSRLTITQDAGSCPLEPGAHLVDDHADGSYAVLRFEAACPTSAVPVTLRYQLLFDLDPTHRGLLTVEDGDRTWTTVLAPERPEVVLNAPAGIASGPLSFFTLGVEHLVFGLDHILFLLVLLLPVAYRRGRDPAHPAPPGAWSEAAALIKILTAFTVAHGISLAVATVGLVDLPSRLVEIAIALTIMLTALDNLRPYLPRRRWAVAFPFGLVHGLSFASAFSPMGLAPLDFVLALLSFNLGIEAAQCLVALAFLAATFPLRVSARYGRFLLPAGSTAALVVAGLWLIGRALPSGLAAF